MALRGMFKAEIDLAGSTFSMAVHADHATTARTFAGNALKTYFAPANLTFHRTAGADRVL